MDESVKDQATFVVEELGLDLPTAMRMFAKQIATTRSIPLSLSLENIDPFYSESNMKVLRESIAELNDPASPKIVKTMAELEAMADE